MSQLMRYVLPSLKLPLLWYIKLYRRLTFWGCERSSTKLLLEGSLWVETRGHHHTHDPHVRAGFTCLLKNLIELWLSKVKRWKSASSFWKIGPMGFYSYFKTYTTVWRKKRWEGQKTFFFLTGSCSYIEDFNNRKDER